MIKQTYLLVKFCHNCMKHLFRRDYHVVLLSVHPIATLLKVQKQKPAAEKILHLKPNPSQYHKKQTYLLVKFCHNCMKHLFRRDYHVVLLSVHPIATLFKVQKQKPAAEKILHIKANPSQYHKS